MAMKIQVEVFWVVKPRSAAIGYQSFVGPLYLHLQSEVKMEARQQGPPKDFDLDFDTASAVNIK